MGWRNSQNWERKKHDLVILLLNLCFPALHSVHNCRVTTRPINDGSTFAITISSNTFMKLISYNTPVPFSIFGTCTLRSGTIMVTTILFSNTIIDQNLCDQSFSPSSTIAKALQGVGQPSFWLLNLDAGSWLFSVFSSNDIKLNKNKRKSCLYSLKVGLVLGLPKKAFFIG